MLRRSVGPTIKVTTELQPDFAPVRIDPNQPEPALLNLAVNARDAMPDGGDPKIMAHAERVAAGDAPGVDPGDYIVIRVGDTGCGMDEATLKQAAEPFFTTKDMARVLVWDCLWWTALPASRAVRCGSAVDRVSAPMSSSGCRHRRPGLPSGKDRIRRPSRRLWSGYSLSMTTQVSSPELLR